MVTQDLTIRLDETELPEIRMVSGDVGREIRIEVYAREDSENPIDLETYSAEITIIKPDNTFIMDNFDGDMYELPEQAGAVSGSGYYQIKIFTSGTRQIYTGQGSFLVDDMILSDDVIESSSIAFGDRFPEDFATKTWVDDEIAAAGIGTYVAGNVPEEETMPPLVKLQINDDIYPLIHKVEEQEDADITNPAEGDVLTYDANDQKWKNEPLVIPDTTVTKTATGNPIEFTDGADAPLVKCTTTIQGYQEGTGTPSPDNVRPIHAYTQSTISVEDENEVVQQTSTATFSQSIYQGNADFVEMAASGTFLLANLSDFTWTYNTQYNYFATSTQLVGAKYPAYAEVPGWLCSCFKWDSIANIRDRGMEGMAISTGGYMAIRATSFAGDLTSFTNAIAGQTIVYELTTPTTETITPTNLPIKSLFGYNHIESSTGDMEIEYITQTYDAITAAPKAEYHKLNSSTIAVPADPGIVVTLPESIYSYDELVITALPDNAYSGTYGTQQTVITRPLEVGQKYMFNIAAIVNMAIYFEVTSETQLTFLRGWPAYEYTITDLTGIKWR